MGVTIAVATYNRLKLLSRMAASLYESNLNIPHTIIICDDASSEFSEGMLRKLFPTAKLIWSQKRNVGADLNTWHMYNKFLSYTDDDILFNADSDLIFSKTWLTEGVRLFQEVDGVLSIFNAQRHHGIQVGEELCEKKILGAAGTFLGRKQLHNFVSSISVDRIREEGIDSAWSKYFNENGIKLYCSSRSYVQHIGFNGYNSTELNFDYGCNFLVDSITNGQSLNDCIEESFAPSKGYRRKYYLFPFSLVGKGSRVVIYGNGVVGKDYVSQIEHSKYCTLISVVDKKYQEMRHVNSPHTLLEMQFDWIIPAVVSRKKREDIKMDVRNISPDFEKKIVMLDNVCGIHL